MPACYANHRLDCIKGPIKLPVRKSDGIYMYINLETYQITVVCSVTHLAILPL